MPQRTMGDDPENVTGKYVLNGHDPVEEPNLMKWCQFMEQKDSRRVATTEVGDSLISTVFLGLNHRFGRDGPPLLFETLVFGGPLNQEMWRYCTWDEAVAGHEMAVKLVKESLN